VQRSVRLSATTSSLLDARAEETRDSRNSIVERLLAEGLRTERHPLIRFVAGGAGVREPTIVGTRLKVRQVIASVRGEGGDVAAVADYLSVEPALVRAAVSYYADFGSEVDADIAWADRSEAEEIERWHREQALLA
jgi:uncharacterized protein (DUF433 family)